MLRAGPGRHESPCAGPWRLQPLRLSCSPEPPLPGWTEHLQSQVLASVGPLPKASGEPEGYLGLFLISFPPAQCCYHTGLGPMVCPHPTVFRGSWGAFTRRYVPPVWPRSCGFYVGVWGELRAATKLGSGVAFEGGSLEGLQSTLTLESQREPERPRAVTTRPLQGTSGIPADFFHVGSAPSSESRGLFYLHAHFPGLLLFLNTL